MTRQKLNQVLALALAAVLTVGLLPIQASAASITFTDVSPSAWYYEDVTCLANKGIVSGVGDNKFEPEREVADCEMLQMVINSFFKSEYDAYEAANYNTMQTYFGSNTYWFSFKAYYAKMTGLLNGINMDINSYTSCYQPMSRYDMALILTNAAKAKGLSATEAQKTNAQSSIADYASIPAAYQDAAKNCFALGLLNGKNGAFAGSDNMTRAEACAVIVRLEKLITNGNTNTDPDPDESATPNVPTVKDIVVTSKNGNIASAGAYGTGWFIEDNGFGDGYLNNGKPITEENVVELLAKAQEIWPTGMIWAKSGNTGNNWYHDQGTVVKNLMTRNTLGTTTGLDSNFACGGFAAMISDYLFGRDNNNFHRVTDTVNGIRPGDIVFIIDPTTNTVYHAFIATSASFTQYEGNGTPYPGFVYKADGNSNGKVSWPGQYDSGTSEANSDYTWQVYSRYPA